MELAGPDRCKKQIARQVLNETSTTGWLGLQDACVSRLAGSPGWLGLQGDWVSRVTVSPGRLCLQVGWVSRMAGSPG